jgi:hypothetical protein
MHVLRYLLGFLLAVGLIVFVFLLVRPHSSAPTVPEPAQPVRLRPIVNSTVNEHYEPVDSDATDALASVTLPGKRLILFTLAHSHHNWLFDLAEVSELDNLIAGDCLVPRYAPYASVVRITHNSIEVKLIDPNEGKATPAVAYKVYYWGHKLSPKGKLL